MLQAEFEETLVHTVGILYTSVFSALVRSWKFFIRPCQANIRDGIFQEPTIFFDAEL